MTENGQNTWEKYPTALPKDTILAGKYIIKDVLGQGGFGITYLAEEYKSKKNVAVKEFFPETMVMRSNGEIEVRTYTDERLENFRFGMESFLEEAKVLVQFKGNPNIVGVQQYFEENGTAYFVMDYIEGIDFKTYIEQNGKKLPWEDVWRIMSPVMEALDTVHKKGLIHRDVTPDNIFISNDGTVKLLDFGASRYSLGDRSKSLDVVLKASYAPKEQYTRRGKQGPFTDVYSVAACFYASLSGFLPPESLDRMEDDNLVMLSVRGVRLSDKTEEAIMKALEVRAEDRFQSMEEFRQAIIASEPEKDTVSENYPKSVQQPSDVKKFSLKKRKGIVIGGVSAVIAAVVIVAAVMSMQSGSPQNHDDYKPVDISIGDVNEDEYKDGKQAKEKITYENGDVYEGELKDGKRDGQGKMTYSNGSVYEGEWKYDVYDGQGKYTFVEGDVYEGEFKNGTYDGQGKMTTSEGDVYEGEFKYNKRNGQGKYTWADGSVYEGEWKDDKENGQGKKYWADGDIYEGELKNGVYDGQGKLILSDGAVYEGEFKSGAYDGQGKYTFASGTVYEGEFKNDAFNGQGKMIYSDGAVYEGEYKDDKRNGQGKYTFSNGAVYEGEFKDGAYDGQGKYMYANGRIYEGEWKNDKKHGKGKLTYKNGSVYEGGFKNNKKDGKGKFTYSDGTVVKGTWKKGKKVK